MGTDCRADSELEQGLVEGLDTAMNKKDDTLPHILDRTDPLWPIQQAFLEVACRSREDNSNDLFLLACIDYIETFDKDPPEHIEKLFREWAPIQAKLTWEMNHDPYMIGLEAAEREGPEALKKFCQEHPMSEYHGEESK